MGVMHEFFVAETGRCRFYAKSYTLKDICSMMAEGMVVPASAPCVNVYVGVHQWITDRLPNDAFNIGIQTEQLFDTNGRKLWGRTSPYLAIIYMSKFDLVIDLNLPDAKAYPVWAFWGNLKFGPYLFSGRRVESLPSNDVSVLFIGTPNERRMAKIAETSAYYPVITLSKTTFNEADASLKRSAALLNIHYRKGVYTEWPRLLMAYLSGKIMVSEELTAPLQSGVHYLPIGAPIDDENVRIIFDNIKKDIADNYRFDSLLCMIDFRKRFLLLRSMVIFLSIRLHLFRATFKKRIKCLKRQLRGKLC